MSSWDYIFLNILMFGYYFVWAKYGRTLKISYISFSIVSTLIFGFVEGCRYDRGSDYMWYKYRYSFPLDDEQPVFAYLNEVLNAIGCNYVVAFIVYALIYFIGIHKLVSSIGENDLKYAFLFVLCSSLLQFEGYVREFIAIPMLFIAMSYIFEKKYVFSIVSVLLAMYTHTATILLFGLFIFFYFYRTRIFPYKVSLLLLLFVYLSTSLDLLIYIESFVSKITSFDVFGGQFSGYIDNSAYWFSEDSTLEDQEQSFLAMLLQFLFESGLIYLGHKILKEYPNEKINIFYNIFIVGAVVTRMFWGVELFARIGRMFYLVWFIPAAYVFERFRINKLSMLSVFSYLSMIVYLLLYWGRRIFFSPDFKFVWSI